MADETAHVATQAPVFVMPETNRNDGLLAAMALASRRNDSPYEAMMVTPMMLAAQNGGLNGANAMWNSPMGMFAMPMMYGAVGGMMNGGFGGFGGWGGRGYGGISPALQGADTAIGATTLAQVQGLQTGLQTLQGQMQDNHNYDLLNSGLNRTQSQLGDMALAINNGFNLMGQDIGNVRYAILEQGDSIGKNIMEQGYQNQLGNERQSNLFLQQSQMLNNVMVNGFTALGNALERNACDVKQAALLNTQKVIDTLNNHWNLEQQSTIQQLRDENGRKDQTFTILQYLANNNGTAAAASAATKVAA